MPRCGPPGLRRARGSRRSDRPEWGGSTSAKRTEEFSLPSSVTAPCDTASCAVKRSRLSISASGFSPRSASSAISRLATMLAMRLPRPMSVSSSDAGAVAGEAQQLLPDRLVLRVVVRQVAQALGAQRLRQQLFAQALGFGMRQGLEVVADLGAGPAGAHEAEPGRVGRRHRRRDHLDHVAVLQFGAQRHLVAVDARRRGVVADVAVDGVGEVDHGRAARQRQDLALGA